VPKGTLFLACTATVTHGIREEIIQSLEMFDCALVSTSPDRPNIYYKVRSRTDIESDMANIVSSLQQHKNTTPRVIFYCRSLDMCANLYAHCHYELGDNSYYPPGSEKLSDHRLFESSMQTPPSTTKMSFLCSLAKSDGVVRVVFATVALGMASI